MKTQNWIQPIKPPLASFCQVLDTFTDIIPVNPHIHPAQKLYPPNFTVATGRLRKCKPQASFCPITYHLSFALGKSNFFPSKMSCN